MGYIAERVDVLRHGWTRAGEYVELSELGDGRFLLWVQPEGRPAKQLGIYGARREDSAREHFASVTSAGEAI